VNIIQGFTLKGLTPLHLACIKGKYREAEILIAHGADVDRLNQANRTSLHIACAKGNQALVRLLVTKTKKINLLDTRDAPLHLAGTSHIEYTSPLIFFFS